MSSPDVTASRTALLSANVRLGLLLLRAEWPPVVWVVGYLIPETLRMLVFVLIGMLVSGADGMAYAFVGCVVLSIATTTVSHVTDLPVTDVHTGTYRSVLLGSVAPFTQYVARALPLGGMALVLATVVAIAVGLLTGQGDLVLPVLSRLWMLIPALFTTIVLGLFVVAPAIGSDWEGITYNGAVALLTVLTGAVFTLTSPIAAGIGSVLPLTHTISALRLSLDGQPWLLEISLEVVVGIGWAIAGALIYRVQDRLGARLGRGAFAA